MSFLPSWGPRFAPSPQNRITVTEPEPRQLMLWFEISALFTLVHWPQSAALPIPNEAAQCTKLFATVRIKQFFKTHVIRLE